MMNDEIISEFTGKNVLVTGGTGLIGRQVVDILCNAGAIVKIVSLDRVHVDERAEHIIGNLTSFDYCKEVTKGMDFVFHLAGVQGTVQTSASKMASHFVPTMMMNFGILEASRQNGVQKLVYTSSIGAYAEGELLSEENYQIETAPMAFAGWAKRMAELQIHAYKTQYNIRNFSVVRLGNIYGPGDNFDQATAMVVPALISRIYHKENPVVIWGDGRAVRDFLYSADAAEGIIRAFVFGTDGEIVNIASGTGTPIRDIVTTLRSFIDFDFTFDATKPSGAQKRIMDISKARKTLGFEPVTDLHSGLQKTWEWFVSHSGEHKNKFNYFDEKDDTGK